MRASFYQHQLTHPPITAPNLRGVWRWYTIVANQSCCLLLAALISKWCKWQFAVSLLLLLLLLLLLPLSLLLLLLWWNSKPIILQLNTSLSCFLIVSILYFNHKTILFILKTFFYMYCLLKPLLPSSNSSVSFLSPNTKMCAQCPLWKCW